MTFLFMTTFLVAFAAGKGWPGVDKAVVEKCALEHGAVPQPCLINLDGDALLFAFLVAGTLGGFVLGYYYRDRFSRKSEGRKRNEG